jgi:surface antigen
MFTFARTSKVLRTTATLALAFAGLAGQAAHADNLNPILGGGLGAMAGAVIGQSMGGRDGAMIGAAVGGVAGVSIASNGERRRYEPPRTVVYEQNYRQQPVVVYEQPYRPAPVVVYQQPYRVVERVNYYPVRDYGRPGWGGHERGWERHGEYRRDWDHRGGWDNRGGDRHGPDRRD